MTASWRPGESAPDYEVASRLLLRRLAQTTDRMAAAEPGTEDFLVAYDESRRLRHVYRQIRETWEVPDEAWAMVPDTDPEPEHTQGSPTEQTSYYDYDAVNRAPDF